MDAHARLVRMEILLFDEAHVIAGDNRHAHLACQDQAGLHAGFFVATSGSDELQVVAVIENVLPGGEPMAGFVRMSEQQRLTDVTVNPAG